MTITVNGRKYPLHGWLPSDAYTILGYLSPMYYLCKGNDGSIFAMYLPNVNEIYPSVY